MAQKAKISSATQPPAGGCPAGNKLSFSEILLPAILCVTLFLSPLLPDVQVSRPKLLVIELGVFCLAVSWLIKTILSDKLQLFRTPLNIPVIIYVLYVSVIFLFSPNKSVAVDELKRMFLCSLIFFLSVNIFNKRNLLRNIVLCGLLAGSGLSMFYGLMQHFGNLQLFGFVIGVPQMSRVASTFGNPIFFAVHLVFFLPLVLGIVFYLNSFKKSRNFLKLLLTAV